MNAESPKTPTGDTEERAGGHGADGRGRRPSDHRSATGVRSRVRTWLEARKPRLGQSGQLFLAEMMWTLVGTGLLTIGLVWVLQRYGGVGLTYALVFASLGLAKAIVILDRVARGAVERIARRSHDGCAGGFFSPQSWIVVLSMILIGQLIRQLPLSQAVIGLLYVAIGTALLFSSRTMWRRWWSVRSESSAT